MQDTLVDVGGPDAGDAEGEQEDALEPGNSIAKFHLLAEDHLRSALAIDARRLKFERDTGKRKERGSLVLSRAGGETRKWRGETSDSDVEVYHWLDKEK